MAINLRLCWTSPCSQFVAKTTDIGEYCGQWRNLSVAATLQPCTTLGTMDNGGHVPSPTGNVVPRKGLRVRAPCPPLSEENHKQAENALFHGLFGLLCWVSPMPTTRQCEGTARDTKRPKGTISYTAGCTDILLGVWWNRTVADSALGCLWTASRSAHQPDGHVAPVSRPSKPLRARAKGFQPYF